MCDSSAPISEDDPTVAAGEARVWAEAGLRLLAHGEVVHAAHRFLKAAWFALRAR